MKTPSREKKIWCNIHKHAHLWSVLFKTMIKWSQLSQSVVGLRNSIRLAPSSSRYCVESKLDDDMLVRWTWPWCDEATITLGARLVVVMMLSKLSADKVIITHCEGLESDVSTITCHMSRAGTLASPSRLYWCAHSTSSKKNNLFRIHFIWFAYICIKFITKKI